MRIPYMAFERWCDRAEEVLSLPSDSKLVLAIHVARDAAELGAKQQRQDIVVDAIEDAVSGVETAVALSASDALTEDNSTQEQQVPNLFRIFISHAEKDKKLAKSLARLLMAGAIPKASIFCSSVPGFGIPNGVKGNDVMKARMQDCSQVIVLITPNFNDSDFGKGETGAAWGMDKPLFVLVANGAPMNPVGVLSGVQTKKLDHIGVWALYDYLQQAGAIVGQHAETWSDNLAFLADDATDSAMLREPSDNKIDQAILEIDRTTVQWLRSEMSFERMEKLINNVRSWVGDLLMREDLEKLRIFLELSSSARTRFEIEQINTAFKKLALSMWKFLKNSSTLIMPHPKLDEFCTIAKANRLERVPDLDYSKNEILERTQIAEINILIDGIQNAFANFCDALRMNGLLDDWAEAHSRHRL